MGSASAGFPGSGVDAAAHELIERFSESFIAEHKIDEVAVLRVMVDECCRELGVEHDSEVPLVVDSGRLPHGLAGGHLVNDSVEDLLDVVR